MRVITEKAFKRNLQQTLDSVTGGKEPITISRSEGSVVLVDGDEWAALRNDASARRSAATVSMRELFTPIKMNGTPSVALEQMRRDELH